MCGILTVSSEIILDTTQVLAHSALRKLGIILLQISL